MAVQYLPDTVEFLISLVSSSNYSLLQGNLLGISWVILECLNEILFTAQLTPGKNLVKTFTASTLVRRAKLSWTLAGSVNVSARMSCKLSSTTGRDVELLEPKRP